MGALTQSLQGFSAESMLHYLKFEYNDAMAEPLRSSDAAQM